MKQPGQLSFVKLRTDNAQHPGNGGRPPADFAFARNQIEMQPGSIRAGNNSLCAQNRAGYRALSDLIQRLAQLVLCIDMRCLNAPAGKDLVRIMSVMMVVMMAALAFLIMVVVMAALAFFIMVMVMAALALFIMVVVMAALTFLIMVVVMRQTIIFLHQLFHQFLLFHRFQNLQMCIRDRLRDCSISLISSGRRAYRLFIFLIRWKKF